MTQVALHDKLSVEIEEYFIQPKTALEALVKARKVISDEKRWCAGAFFSSNDVEENDDGRRVLTCKNVRVCAVGALALVIDNGAIIYDQMKGRRDCQVWLQSHEIGAPALELLDRAASSISPNEDYTIGNGEAIIVLNDQVLDAEDLDDEQHLSKVQKVFDLAIDEAKRLGV